ncbi:MAG: hypothetical protein ABIH59_03425 [archaeon]
MIRGKFDGMDVTGIPMGQALKDYRMVILGEGDRISRYFVRKLDVSNVVIGDSRLHVSYRYLGDIIELDGVKCYDVIEHVGGTSVSDKVLEEVRRKLVADVDESSQGISSNRVFLSREDFSGQDPERIFGSQDYSVVDEDSVFVPSGESLVSSTSYNPYLDDGVVEKVNNSSSKEDFQDGTEIAHFGLP